MKSRLLRMIAILAVTGGIVAGTVGPVAATPPHQAAAPGQVNCGDCVWHD